MLYLFNWIGSLFSFRSLLFGLIFWITFFIISVICIYKLSLELFHISGCCCLTELWWGLRLFVRKVFIFSSFILQFLYFLINLFLNLFSNLFVLFLFLLLIRLCVTLHILVIRFFSFHLNKIIKIFSLLNRINNFKLLICF